MTQQACIIHQLHFELGSTVLFDQLDFQLNRHQLTGLIGRNGQGKSQLLQCLLTQKNSRSRCSTASGRGSAN